MDDFNVIFTTSNSTDLRCDRVGLCSVPASQGILNEYCDAFSLIYMLSGEIRVRMNMDELLLSRGKVYLVQPETAFAYADKQAACYAYWVFDGRLPRRKFSSNIQCKCAELSGAANLHMREYLSDKFSGDFNCELRTMALVLDALKEFDTADSENYTDTGAGNEFIDKFVNEVNANYRENITVEKICKKIGISINYFTNYFMRNMRITPRQFIIDVRLSKAKEMLLTTNLSIDEIGQYVGYGDAFTFSRAFKKKTGDSPSMFRRKQRLGNIPK